MKDDFKGISLADLCSWFGVTRQAYYQPEFDSYLTYIKAIKFLP